MNYQEIRNHYITFSEWLKSLKKIDNDQWIKPLSEGKWTVGAVISHLLYWDKYSLNERFPLFKEGAILERFPDFQKVNDQAEEYSKMVPKDQLLDELLQIRDEYISMIDKMKEEDLEISFQIGDHRLTIEDYFKDFVGHDIHHKDQVIHALEN